MHESIALICMARSAKDEIERSVDAAGVQLNPVLHSTHRIDDGGLLAVVLPVELVAILAGQGAPEPLRSIVK